MINTPNWESAQDRIAAMLHGEKLDRPCIAITAPKTAGGQVPAPRGLHNPHETDADALLDQFEAHMDSVLYLGEATPSLSLSFGPDQFGAFLGCDLQYAEDRYTSWAVPNITDWDDSPSLTFDHENDWWKRMVASLGRAAERAEGRYLLSCPDTHAGGDALAAMRGQQTLCLDVVDHPERVEWAMELIEEALVPYFDGIFGILRQQGAHTSCMGCAMPGTSVTVQCDFIALISTEMVKRFLLKEIRIETEYVDHCFFHLDGPDAIKHLDTILDLPQLDGLNYVKGFGRDFTFEHEMGLYRRVQDAGKIAVLGCGRGQLEAVLEALDPNKLFLRLGASSEEEARAILKTAEGMASSK